MSLIVAVTLVLISLAVLGGRTDKTLEPGASGREVAESAYNRVRHIFPDDHGFLIRVAFIESNFGHDLPAFEKGGIWRVGPVALRTTQSAASQTQLKPLQDRIQKSFGISWNSVIYKDIKKPLYNLLAARLHLLIGSSSIPQSIEGQSYFWKVHFSSFDSEVQESPEKFVKEVQHLESCQLRPRSKCNLNLVTVLDGSGSIGSKDFNNAKEFIRKMVDCILPSKDTTGLNRLGFVIYSENAEVIFPLNSGLTRSKLVSKILEASYPEESTNTASGISIGSTVFANQSLDYVGLPRLLIVLTDGQSNSISETVAAAKKAWKSGISLYTVGIGLRVNRAELRSIVGRGNPERVFSIDSYTTLVDVLYNIRAQACSQPQLPVLGSSIRSFLRQDEVSHYSYPVPPSGITIQIRISQGSTHGYYSYKARNPSSALNDGILEAGNNWIPHIPRSDRRIKRNSASDAELTNRRNQTVLLPVSVYLTIQGIERNNTYTLLATPAPATIRNSGVSILILTSSTVLLILPFVIRAFCYI